MPYFEAMCFQYGRSGKYFSLDILILVVCVTLETMSSHIKLSKWIISLMNKPEQTRIKSENV